MKLASLRNADTVERRIAIAIKRLSQRFRPKCETTPVFVLGKQRSGTSMLMQTFHRHREVLVFDEHKCNEAFLDYRLRDYDTIHRLLSDARFPFVCMKPICDSHLIRELYREFPQGQFVWLYRDFNDVANSSLRKFESPTHAIRLVCTNQQGGGWFQEGVSHSVSDTLQEVYSESLSDFELACLVWWARNQIAPESELLGGDRITVLKYENLVTDPVRAINWLFERLGIEFDDNITRKISARSIGKNEAPPVQPEIQSLCERTLATLDAAYFEQRPPI